MSVELTVPEVGESITEVQVGRWLRDDGATVSKDEDLVEIETDKASVVIAAPEAGVLSITTGEGAFANVGAVIATIEPTAAGAEPPRDEATGETDAGEATGDGGETGDAGAIVMPAAARLAGEHGIDAESITGSGPGGRVLKEDVQHHLDAAPEEAAGSAAAAESPSASPAGERGEEIRPMSMIRRTIASRLVGAQQSAALLTTFNEVDMQPVMALRQRHKELFEKRHGVRLGFMSFFAKAAVAALQRFPTVNAEVRGTDVVYRAYQDIGIAIGGGKGLLVPVMRNVETMSFAQIEAQIADFAARAQDNKITPDELEGGTFTISNGGIYGSLLSTPIVNSPQSGILGMHAIQDRPVVRDGEIVIRPMMYVAFTYDHRIIDGREAVTFLKTIKEVLEDPARLVLEV